MKINSAESVIKKYNMLKSGETVAVGVSGGADSMLLLTYLFSKRDEFKIRVIAANVEHGIRGESSVKDSEFVKRYCESNGIEFCGISINAPEEAKKCGEGIEEYSRRKRYEFFNSLGADKIATAHNLSDNVETLLFRLSRGTSNRGACAIPPVRDNIIRPFIELSGEEIRSLCSEYGVPYVVDETNLDNVYSRNYIRNELVPAFKKLNPSFEKAASRYISSVTEDEKCLEDLSLKYEFPLSIKALSAEYPAVSKRAIERYANEFGITLDENRLNAVYSLVFKSGREQIKGSFFAVSDGDYLTLKNVDNSCKNAVFSYETRTVDKEYFDKNALSLKKEFDFYCDCDKISGDITLRQRIEGDSITLASRGCTKSLKKLMNELKIPAELRGSYAVICDGEGVIGVADCALSERVRVDNKTEKVLLMKISLEDTD